MYEKEILDAFVAWAKAQTEIVPMEKAKRYGQYFLANHVDPAKAETRGDVYELFEKYLGYLDVMDMTQPQAINMNEQANLRTLARGVIWAVQHDGFDSIKWTPIDRWGEDISKMRE